MFINLQRVTLRVGHLKDIYCIWFQWKMTLFKYCMYCIKVKEDKRLMALKEEYHLHIRTLFTL